MELRKLLLCSLLVAGSVRATTRTVTSLADSGVGSLRAAIAASANGDSIVFAVSGTIKLVILNPPTGNPLVACSNLGTKVTEAH